MSLDVNISEPDEFNCIELHNCIESVAEIYNIKEFTYHVDCLFGKGEHYIANVFRVTIKESNSDNSVSVIVKTLINTNRQELFKKIHNREVDAYRNVIDKFILLQNDIDANERIVLPKCIYVDTSNNSEIIILEDLTLHGYVIDSFKKYDIMDYSQVRLIITELAKFHSLSFIFKNREDNNFRKIRNDFSDLIFQEDFLNKTKLRNYYHESFQSSLDLIRNENVKKKLEIVKEKLLELLRIYTETKEYSVFCHGDLWVSNILFKEEGSQKQVCFLDFQAMRYASPVTDILYFLYICTDSTFRSQYFEDLKIVYYDTLKSFLKLFNIEVNSVYPQDDFNNDIKEMKPFGLLIALVELNIVTTSPEDQVITEDRLHGNEDTNPKYDHGCENLHGIRVNDVIDESIDNGVMNKFLDLFESL